jgi:hypothetical protein
MRHGTFTLLVICALAVLPAQIWAQDAVIQELNGKVEIKVPGKDWVNAVEGQTLENAAMISTGFKGTALIVLGNSLLTIRPLTRLTLEEIRERQSDGGVNEKVNLEMQTGRVRADVNPPAGGKIDFTVRSPSATASVRGTVFEFDGKQLSVRRGKVALTGGDGASVYVSEGHQVATNVETGRTPNVTETVRHDMTPKPPAGINSTEPPRSPSTPPEPSAPSGGSVDVGFNW